MRRFKRAGNPKSAIRNPKSGAFRIRKGQVVLPENSIVRAIADYCRLVLRAEVYDNRKNGTVSFLEKGKQRFMRFGGGAGWPDLFVFLPGGRTLFIEAKARDGRQTADQHYFQQRAAQLGHWYTVAHSPDELQAFLDARLREERATHAN